ncbi:M20 family metallopeptidase [Nocardia sp. NPDC088792]|uniref:M20 family metallopeptidase n=1 Tax=Nocardia sp. NPDC088792 TaxID=3364332 RepID=UPI00382E7E9B
MRTNLPPLELLERMIEIPSVNPRLSRDPADGEGALGHWLADYLGAHGIRVELQKVEDDRVNMIGHLPRSGTADSAVVLLSAHMDTYPRYGELSGFRAQVSDGRMSGRGSADAKGSLAAMVAAFVRAAQSPTHRESYLAATVDEECLLLGCKQLAQYGIRPDLAITGEPTQLVPIVAQKGIVRGQFTVTGPKVHAAYPKSETALAAAAALVQACAGLNEELAALRPSELGPPTVTPTAVECDGGMNLVARNVAVSFDARFPPGRQAAEFLREIEHRLRERLGDSVPFEVGAEVFESPANRCDLSGALVGEFVDTITAITGQPGVDSFSYGSEAGVLAQFSGNSLVFGPGDPRYSHAVEEWLDIDELLMATTIFERILTGPARPDGQD